MRLHPDRYASTSASFPSSRDHLRSSCECGSLSAQTPAFLRERPDPVKILIAGGTRAGKATLLNGLGRRDPGAPAVARLRFRVTG
jgi:Flp pilus assembly CpaF family ATPase